MLPELGIATAGNVALLTKSAIDHIEGAHDAVLTGRIVRSFMQATSFMADSKRWSAVHQIHHEYVDANLLPFVAFADFLDWNASSHGLHLEVPDEIYGLDPVLKHADTEFARAIGQRVKEDIDGKYKPQESYTTAEAERMLWGRDPRYFYEDRAIWSSEGPITFDPEHPPSLQDIRFLIRDPHSPPLHRKGIPGVFIDNFGLYGYVERNLQDSVFVPEALHPTTFEAMVRKHRGVLRIGAATCMITANVAINRLSHKPHVLQNIATGAIATAGSLLLPAIQYSVTNSFGHGGDMSKQTIVNVLEGVVYPYPDGTYANNSKLLGPLTNAAVAYQRDHHDQPQRIAYSTEQGILRVAEAPLDVLIEKLADKGLLFAPGNDFNGQSPRPDEPHEVVVALQEKRAAYLDRYTNLAV